MPLTLYAVDFLRLRDPDGRVDPTRPVLDERALSAGEISHNRKALAARVTAGDPHGGQVWRRLVAPSAGGIGHARITVFARDSDPDLLAIRHFLETVRAR